MIATVDNVLLAAGLRAGGDCEVMVVYDRKAGIDLDNIA